LWGWLGIVWTLAMAVALLPHAAVRVEPGDYSHAEILAAATVFACAGLAVASTALLGTRRILLPAAIAIGFAWLGAQAARGFDHAAGTLEELRADIVRARAAAGRNAHVLVVDAPDRAGGLDLAIASLRDLAEEPGTREPRRIVHEALGSLSRSSEFSTWRVEGLVLVTPAAATVDARAARTLRIVPPAAGSPPPVLWPRGDNRSEILDLDPGATHAARIVGLPTTSTAEAPRLGWRVSEPAGEMFDTIGVWLRGESAPVAVFDLAGSSDWWMAPTVLRVSTKRPFLEVASGEMLGDIPLDITGGAPRVRGDDWTFAIERATLPAPVRGTATYVLELLDMASLDFARIDVEESGGETTLGLLAPGAAGFERAVRERSAGTLVWSLERRVGGVVIARASGRRG
jgi:hypothetical protein